MTWREKNKLVLETREKAVTHTISQQKEQDKKEPHNHEHKYSPNILKQKQWKNNKSKTKRETNWGGNKKHLETILDKLESVLDDIKEF